MDVKFGLGPNGQFGPLLVFDDEEPETPQSYTTNFQTPEGVPITVTYQTPDQNVATNYQTQIEEKMAWAVLETPSEEPPGLGEQLVEVMVASTAAAALTFLSMWAIGLFMGTYDNRSDSWPDWIGKHVMAGTLVVFLTLAVLGTASVLICWKPETK